MNHASKFLLLMGVFLTMAAAAFCGTEDPSYYLNRGVAELAKSDFDAAIADFTKAIELKPDLGEAYANRGIAKRAKAVQKQAKAVQKRERLGLIQVPCRACKGYWDDAIADYSKAIELQPDPFHYMYRGTAKHEKGDLDGAIADYNKAIELAPGYGRAYENRSLAKRAKGDLDGANADHAKAIELKPDLADAADYLKLGDAKRDKGDLDGAIADYTEVIRLDPDGLTYTKRGVARMAKGDVDGAIADYTEAIRQYTEAGQKYTKQEHTEHQKYSTQEFLASMAAFEASAYADRGIAKSGKGDWDGAIEDFTKIYELRPRWSEAALRSPQSLEISRVAAKVTPDFAIAYNNRGIVKGAKGDLDGAIKDFNEAIRLRPDLAQLYNNRGISEEAKGDKDGANADFAKATQLRPKPAPTEGSPPPIRAYGVVGPTSAVPTDSAHFREYGKQDLRERCIPFADGSVDKVLAKTMPLPPKECREVLGWMRDSRLTTLYDGQPKQ